MSCAGSPFFSCDSVDFPFPRFGLPHTKTPRLHRPLIPAPLRPERAIRRDWDFPQLGDLDLHLDLHLGLSDPVPLFDPLASFCGTDRRIAAAVEHAPVGPSRWASRSAHRSGLGAPHLAVTVS